MGARRRRDGQENGRIQGICDPDCDTRSLHRRTDPSSGQTYCGTGASRHGRGDRFLFIRPPLRTSRPEIEQRRQACLPSGGGSAKIAFLPTREELVPAQNKRTFHSSVSEFESSLQALLQTPEEVLRCRHRVTALSPATFCLNMWKDVSCTPDTF